MTEQKLGREKQIMLNDNQHYTLSFDMNAMILLEEEFERNPFSNEFYEYFFGKLDEDGNVKGEGRVLSPKEVIKLLYAFLNSNHESLSKREISKLIDFNNFKDVFQQMMDGFNQSLPAEDEKDLEESGNNQGSGEKKV